MPTQKPIISIVLDEETLKRVEDFQFNNRIPSRSKALNEIIKLGILELEKEEKEEK
jgi:metal-responsive CopG/Arc/MetJ family transcriptional regulator